MHSKRSSAMRFLLCSSVVLTASAGVIRAPLQRRAEDCQLETMEDMADDLDRFNTDGTAGIGAEFESPGWQFVSTGCSTDDTNAAKRKVIADRTGTNWELTADSIGQPGKLQAEYIIDGVKVKVGSTDDTTNGAKVAASFVQDLIDWKPWNDPDPAKRTVDIADNKCNPWRIALQPRHDPKKIYFQPQITTPMPLEALYTLMVENVADPDPVDRNVLDGENIRYPGNKYLRLVTKEHFQTSPGGISPERVTDDVLAFCTLVMAYAKAARENRLPEQSPKIYTSFMPRTNFNKMFSHVSSKLPAKGDDLWALFNILACYQGNGNEIDTDLCTGDPGNPVPIDNKFGDLTFTQGDSRCNIHDWIHGLDPDSQDNDALTEFDKAIDGSIGNLGTTQEKMFNSQRSVPLFEFRDLSMSLKLEGIEDFMKQVDETIQKLHNDFATAPGKKVRRQEDIICTPALEEEPAPSPVPTTLPPEEEPAPSPVPTAEPSSS